MQVMIQKLGQFKDVCTLRVLRLVTSLAKGGYIFGSIDLSICLFICGQHYTISYEWIGMKLYGVVLGGTMKN